MRYFLIFIFLIAPVGTIEAQQSNGHGGSLKDAVVDAIYNVMDAQSGGIINRDNIKNIETAFSALTNNPAGLISDLNIIEKNQMETGEWEVSLNVTVDESVLKADDIEQEIKQKIVRWEKIQNGLFRNRSVVVVYDDRKLINAVQPDAPEVLSVIDKIENQLAGLHFDVIVSDLNLAALKRQESVTKTADAVVIVTLQKMTDRYEKSEGVTYIQITVNLKAYDTQTQRVLANFTARKKDLVKGNADIITDALSRIAGKAGEAATAELMRGIVKNYNLGSVPVLMTINSINEDQMDALIDGLKIEDISYKVERYSDEGLKIKLITELDALATRRIVRKIAILHGFKLKTISQYGDTLKMEVRNVND